MSYAEIILPIAGSTYTFSVPTDLADGVVVGCVVSVQFGVRQVVMGIVLRLSQQPPAGIAPEKLKPVLSLVHPEPVVDGPQLALWEWLAEYYMCTLGEVMRAAVPTLLRKGDFEPYKRKSRNAGSEPLGPSSPRLPQLSFAQLLTLDELHSTFGNRDVALLFGVPSGGKSEIGFHAAAEILASGRDVLLLLPEISLSTQFVTRVEAVFGDRVMLYHSGLTDRRRADVYLRMLNRNAPSCEATLNSQLSNLKSKLIVGTRSAIFLPFKNLGLVIVDEEQDSGYKQQDPAPRYNARDAAIVLSRIHNAKTLLMSATPSLETWFNAGGDTNGDSTGTPRHGSSARSGAKYGIVELTRRFSESPPPRMTISDTLRSAKRGERKSHFNKELLDRIRETLTRGEQVILFQNRRGVAPYVECPDCGYVPRCPHCGIPFSVHRRNLQCHYCGATDSLPIACPSCARKADGDSTGESKRIGPSRSEPVGFVTKGFGTQKIEDELSGLFPDARLVRLDRDSVGSQTAYNKIITAVERGEADILIGTQMVTKGLDFAGVSLVGILNADNLVNHPDFRASERAYQLIAQVSGRAGRRSDRGEVVLQTASPSSRLIAQGAAGDFRAMASEQLAERALYGYPPYTRLISVMLRHKDRDTLAAAAVRFSEELRVKSDEFSASFDILGPQPPVTERVKGEFALLFLLKVPRSVALSSVRTALSSSSRTLLSEPAFRRVVITPDVDPQ